MLTTTRSCFGQKKAQYGMLSDQPQDSQPLPPIKPLGPGAGKEGKRRLRWGYQSLYPPHAPYCTSVNHPAALDRLLERLNLGHECYTAGWGQHSPGTWMELPYLMHFL